MALPLALALAPPPPGTSIDAAPFLVLQYVDLRTRYSELSTLSSQYIKFITETLRRLEEEEVRWRWG